MEMTCKAAMVRTFRHEGGTRGIDWERLRRKSEECRGRTEFLGRWACWRGWYKKHIPTILCRTNAAAERDGMTSLRAREALTNVCVGPLLPSAERKLRKGLQRWLATEMLARTGFKGE